jgi:bifunctional non-homologous end joining protein LigD
MLATTGDLPAGPEWAFEFKWDGVRAIADLSRRGTRLWARSGAEITLAYPELVPLGNQLADALLDGEIVALDAAGRPSFQALAERMHVRERGRAARLAGSIPVTYMIFDLLRLGDVDLTGLPYVERRSALERLELAGPHWLVPPTFLDGSATREAARENHLEGVVAKRLSSTYRPGVRSLDWIKQKQEETADLVIGGWRPGARRLGSLLVGYPLPDGRLRFCGRVGGGISAAAQQALLDALEPLRVRQPPFDETLPKEDAKDATWVRPEIVVEVRYGQLTPDGRLRFPRFVRLRPDKTVADCLPEKDGSDAR